MSTTVALSKFDLPAQPAVRWRAWPARERPLRTAMLLAALAIVGLGFSV